LEQMSLQTIKFEEERKKAESELVYRERSRNDLDFSWNYGLGGYHTRTRQVQEPRGKLPWPDFTFAPEKQLN